MEMATLPLRLYERTGVRKLVYALGLRNFLPGQLKDMEAMLPHLPQRPLRQALPQISEAKSPSKYRVGFFLGCAQNLLFAEESAATVRVLARNGCTVITPKETVCCGMPAAGYGRQDLVLEQARKNISIFENIDVETIITDCATCGSALKEYGTLLAEDPQWVVRAIAFSKKVKDISEFLMSIPLEKPKGVIGGRVTYHDPCHLRRGQGIWEQPRDLLKLIEGIEFTELPEADWCCGSAGSQMITHYQTSLKVLSRKMDSLENTNADFIASGCPGCQMQLSVGVKRRKLKAQVVHPIQLLDKAYQNE
jgi:glycolate oxidase iron-sulfur subunit